MGNLNDNVEQRALEFLAAEYERDGKAGSAEHIRTQPLLPNKARAVRAIAAALRHQPAPVDLEQFREAVGLMLIYGRDDEHARAKRLLSIIDSAGKVGADASFAEWLAKEMPAGTVIGDPAWWADRIARKYSKRTAQQPAAVVDDAVRKDAERYRYLRGLSLSERALANLCALTGEKMGAAIDADIAAMNGANDQVQP